MADRRRRVLSALGAHAGRAKTQRVLWPNQETNALEAHGVDLLGQERSSASSRRLQRSNAQVVATTASVFAAVRWREQAITRPDIVLLQSRGGEWDEVGTIRDPDPHPALAALRRMNDALTMKQGIGGIERGKLTEGHHILVKRRDVFGTPREFEVWSGATSWAVPRTDRPWSPEYFAHRDPQTGAEVQVGAEDAIWFRHIINPANPMLSITPIAAIRVSTDTALEAMRSNQRYFDQGVGAGAFITPKEESGASPAEIERLRAEMEAEISGTDNHHRWHFWPEPLELLNQPQSNRDLEFAVMMLWGVREVARAFEMSPITLKDFEYATYTNADQATAQDWETVRNQLDATVEELNEYYIRPDFGPDFRLEARYAGIAALQESAKTAAEVDSIRRNGGYETINEQRHRDGKPPVEWGDVPIMPSNMVPLGSVPAGGDAGSLAEATGEPPVGADIDGESDADEDARAHLRAQLALVDQAYAGDWTPRQLKNRLRALGATR